MFGLEMLDVVIGLVFFYLLLSLLASAIQEFIAGILKLRSKTLVKSIEELLNQVDESHAKGGDSSKSIAGSLNIKGTPKEESSLYESFINQHSHYGKAEEVSVQASVRSIAPAKGNAPTKKSSLASTFFGKAHMPSYLSSKSFADILTHVLHSDQDIHGIAASIGRLPAGKTKTSLQVMLKNAKNDVDSFKHHLSEWFDESMDRVSGRYKRQTQRILIGIGLILSLIFNADTLTIASKLAEDKSARIELLQSAITYQQGASQSSRTTQRLLELPSSDLDVLDTTGVRSATPPANSLAPSSTPLDTLIDIHQTIKHMINEELASSTSTLGLGWNQESNKRASYFKQTYFRSVPQTRGAIKTDPDWKNHKWLYFKSWFSWWAPRIGGWLLTAMAVSLGAPFWFDMLNKLINMRSSGQKPPTARERVASEVNPS